MLTPSDLHLAQDTAEFAALLRLIMVGEDDVNGGDLVENVAAWVNAWSPEVNPVWFAQLIEQWMPDDDEMFQVFCPHCGFRYLHRDDTTDIHTCPKCGAQHLIRRED